MSAAVSPQAAAASIDADHPWPGLVAFTETSSRFFFGREQEVDELFRRVRREVTTLFFGRSGLGKSSLLQAGLGPRLRQGGYLPIRIRLDYSPEAVSLSAQVKALFDAAVLEEGVTLPAGPGDSFWERFHQLNSHLLGKDGHPVTPVFIFDQFEEVFTLGLGRDNSRGGAQAFLAELADLIENRCPAEVRARFEQDPDSSEGYDFARDDYRLVIALREDYLPNLETLRARAPSLGRNRMRLLGLTGRQAHEAVIGPGGDLLTDDIARQIVEVIGRRRPEEAFAAPPNEAASALEQLDVEPALLSLFCLELNQRRLDAGLSQMTPELVAGGQDTILDTFYDRALANQPEALRDFIEKDLVLDSGVRENVSLERARQTLKQQGVPIGALDQLVDARILHVIERPEGPRIELIHDVLVDVVRRSQLARRERHAADERRRADVEAEAARAREAHIRKVYARWLRALAAILFVVVAGGAGALFLVTKHQDRKAETLAQALTIIKACYPDAVQDQASSPTLPKGHDQLSAITTAPRPTKAQCGAAIDAVPTLAKSTPALGGSEAKDAFRSLGLIAENIGSSDPTTGSKIMTNAMTLVQNRNPNGDDELDLLVAIGDDDLSSMSSALKKPAPALKLEELAVTRLNISNHANVAIYSKIGGNLYARLGQLYSDAGRTSDSIVAYKEALTLGQTYYSDLQDSNTPTDQLDAAARSVAGSQIDLGFIYVSAKDDANLKAGKDLFNACDATMRPIVLLRPTSDNRWAAANCQFNLGIALSNRKQYASSLGPLKSAQSALEPIYTQVIDTNSPTYDRSVDENRTKSYFDLLVNLYDSYSSIAEVSNKLVDRSAVAPAETYADMRVAVTEAAYKRLGANEYKDKLVSAYGNRAWMLLLEQRPDAALKDNQSALKLDPTQDWILVNEAHAYLFLGRFDDAAKIYLAEKDKPRGDGKKILVDILQDFDEFRRAGIAPHDLADMQSMLTKG